MRFEATTTGFQVSVSSRYVNVKILPGTLNQTPEQVKLKVLVRMRVSPLLDLNIKMKVLYKCQEYLTM